MKVDLPWKQRYQTRPIFVSNKPQIVFKTGRYSQVNKRSFQFRSNNPTVENDIKSRFFFFLKPIIPRFWMLYTMCQNKQPAFFYSSRSDITSDVLSLFLFLDVLSLSLLWVSGKNAPPYSLEESFRINKEVAHPLTLFPP